MDCVGGAAPRDFARCKIAGRADILSLACQTSDIVDGPDRKGGGSTKRIAELFLVLGLMCWPAVPQARPDQNGQYQVVGVGNHSCGEWTQGRRTATEYVDMAWVQGFITAVNLAGPGSSNISKETDPDGILAWIDNYCAKDPLESLFSAVAELTAELLKREEATHAQ